MVRNFPNILTGLRLILVPFVTHAVWTGDFRSAAVLLFVAGSTDALDGFLARRYAWTSRIGAYLDPLADKALQVCVYLALGAQGAAPRWLVWLVLGRDLLILAMVAIAFLFTQVRSFPPSVWGKLSTVAQVTTALALVVGRAYSSEPHPGLESVLITATAALTAASGLHYMITAIQRLTRR